MEAVGKTEFVRQSFHGLQRVDAIARVARALPRYGSWRQLQSEFFGLVANETTR